MVGTVVLCVCAPIAVVYGLMAFRPTAWPGRRIGRVTPTRRQRHRTATRSSCRWRYSRWSGAGECRAVTVGGCRSARATGHRSSAGVDLAAWVPATSTSSRPDASQRGHPVTSTPRRPAAPPDTPGTLRSLGNSPPWWTTRRVGEAAFAGRVSHSPVPGPACIVPRTWPRAWAPSAGAPAGQAGRRLGRFARTVIRSLVELPGRRGRVTPARSASTERVPGVGRPPLRFNRRSASPVTPFSLNAFSNFPEIHPSVVGVAP